MDKNRLNVYMTIKDGLAATVVVYEGVDVLHHVYEIDKTRANKMTDYLALLNTGVHKATALLNTKLLGKDVRYVNFVISSQTVINWVTRNQMGTSDHKLFLDTVAAIDGVAGVCSFSYRKTNVASRYCDGSYLKRNKKLDTVRFDDLV